MKRRMKVVFILAALVVLASCTQGKNDAAASTPKSHLYRVMEKGVIRVGIIPDNPGWSTMKADGTWVGYDVEIANQLAKTLGVKLEIVSCEGNQRVPLVQSDNVDIVISCTGATSERAKSVTFSHPYAGSGALGLAKKGRVPKSWDDIVNYKIAVPRGSTQDIFITNAYPNADIVRFDSIADAFIAVQTGKADVLLEQMAAVYELVKKNPDMAAMNVEPASAVYVCMVMQHGDSIWHDYVNRFIDNNLYNGNWPRLYKEIFGFDLPKIITY